MVIRVQLFNGHDKMCMLSAMPQLPSNLLVESSPLPSHSVKEYLSMTVEFLILSLAAHMAELQQIWN